MNKHFRPPIQNGHVAKRTQVTYGGKMETRASLPLIPVSAVWSGQSVEVGTLTQRGLSLLGLDERLNSTKPAAKATAVTRPTVLIGLLVCGTLLAGGFMFSLRDHFIAHAFGREEVRLKSRTDQANTERQHLKAQTELATSPQELDRAARESNGLAPLEFDQKKVISGVKKITAAEKAKKPSVPQSRARPARN